MTVQRQRLVLVGVGIGLVVAGHRLVDVELGRLGLPHVVGAALLAAAMRMES